MKYKRFFKGIYNFDEKFLTDGSQFDKLFQDNETFKVDSLNIQVIPTPGHTPACCSYLINDSIFVGDALFMPDSGTGRCDFPKGNSEQLFESITKNLYSLNDHFKIYTGHDYQPNGRDQKFQSTIGEQKKNNIQLNEYTTKEKFAEYRKRRDSELKAPRLLLPSIQVNINAGLLPSEEANGRQYLKIPLSIKDELS